MSHEIKKSILIVDDEKGLSLGAADYIHKPFHAPIVKIRVKNQMDIIERYELEKVTS